MNSYGQPFIIRLRKCGQGNILPAFSPQKESGHKPIIRDRTGSLPPITAEKDLERRKQMSNHATNM